MSKGTISLSFLFLIVIAVLIIRTAVQEVPTIGYVVATILAIIGLGVTAAWLIGERQHGTSKTTFYFYMIFTAAVWAVIYCVIFKWV
ncbi:hypothetical protein ALQ79_200223 [Pseudomonas amygdali pv. lachrymans]|nr:hypothetical protein ALQ79_200223 [Pseudomonas amygdali pv. lachrymans]